jgi:hypothetical protein
LSRFIAIDWDGSQAYLIAGRVRGAGQVEVQKALTWTEEEPPLTHPERAGQRLRDRLRDAGISPAPVLTCVGRGQIVVKEVRFPAVPELEEPAVVRFQAIKELADNPEDVVIDYFSRSLPTDIEKRAAAVALRKKTLDAHMKLCQAAGLRLQAVTPRLVGVMVSLRKVMGTTVVTPHPEPMDGAYCVVLAGEQVAEVAILKGDKFLLSRSVPTGLGLAAEVRRNLMVHAGQEPNNPVVAVYVGGKGTGELRERIGELIGDVPVHTYDPFAGSEALAAGQLPAGNRGLFAGPMGLLQMQSAGELPINFMAPRQPKPPDNPNIALLRLAGLVTVGLVVLLFLSGYFLLGAAEANVTATNDQLKDTERALDQAMAKGRQLQAINEREIPSPLDEIWELAKRADLKQLRVSKVEMTPLPRTGKSRFYAKMTITGVVLPGSASARLQAYDNLIRQFTREKFYSIDNTQSRYLDPNFTLVVNVEQRAPSAYTSTIEDPTKVKDKAAKDKAGKAPADKKGRKGK